MSYSFASFFSCMQETDPLPKSSISNYSAVNTMKERETYSEVNTMDASEGSLSGSLSDSIPDDESLTEETGLVNLESQPLRRRSLGRKSCKLCLSWLLMIGVVAVLTTAGLFVWKQRSDTGRINVGDTTTPSSSSGSAFSSSGNVQRDPHPLDKTTEATASSASSSTRATTIVDKDALETLMKDAHVSKAYNEKIVYYDPTASLQAVNPFDFTMPKDGILEPPMLWDKDHVYTPNDSDRLGYLRQPNIHNNNLVFCSEGDIFVTTISKDSKQLSATKLTKTVGNVGDPRLHPSMRYLAYTATYSGRRDIYLMDFQKGGPAIRLTYWDLNSGVSGLIGWWGNDLVFRAMSNEVSLRDYRLYVLHLDLPSNERRKQNEKDTDEQKGGAESKEIDAVSVLSIDPIPLAQAIDAARLRDCWYFVRFSQSSRTIRYVGGTAESLWSYCDGHKTAKPAIDNDNYNGTSKSPQIYNEKMLFFLSDRGLVNGEYVPDRMNIWAYDLEVGSLIQITDTVCDFEGRTIQEYTIDSENGNIVVRIGADLYLLESSNIEKRLDKGRRHLPDDDDEKGTNAPNAEEVVSEKDEGGAESDMDKETTAPDEEEDVNEDDEEVTESGNDTETPPPSVTQSSVPSVLDGNQTDSPASEETGSTVYYSYKSETESAPAVEHEDHHSGESSTLHRLPIMVHSDFSEHQERLLPVKTLRHLKSADVYDTTVGSTHFLMNLRGQVWVAPVIKDGLKTYEGAGMNIPERRYRVAPGAMLGGVVRILTTLHVPNPVEDGSTNRRLAVVLATDPLTDTAEHAFYLIETQSDLVPSFLDLDHLPKPFLGGHISGGSTKDGGLGSVRANSLTVSPCGRRLAWTDTDGRIGVMNMPQYQDLSDKEAVYEILATENELGESMMGDEVDLAFSPGGRYLAINHNAKNQFLVISIADLGDPEGEDKVADINIGRIVQATPSRFNSQSMYWGVTTKDIHDFERDSALAKVLGLTEPDKVSTTLYFLSDRDILSDVSSPWGTRMPLPHFKKSKAVYALPLHPVDLEGTPEGPFSGGGAAELKVDEVLERKNLLKQILEMLSSEPGRRLTEKLHPLTGAFGLAENSFGKRRVLNSNESEEEMTEGGKADESLKKADFPKDMDIDFGPVDLSFARQAYRLTNIPEANYYEILCQLPDNGGLVVVEAGKKGFALTVFVADDYPSDDIEPQTFEPVVRQLVDVGLSTSREYFYLGFVPDGKYKVVPNSAAGILGLLSDPTLDYDVVDTDELHLSIWPSLEYRQMYSDAWRMLRDYFYDPEMTGIDWPTIHERYLPLVDRCSKREELDDVLAQMASELSALHVFVYGGEYNNPTHGDRDLAVANEVASLGAVLKRTPEWKGYKVMSIPERDPDFSFIDGGTPIYSPLSDQTLRLSGQKGLQVGDVIVGINGESVMRVPDIHMLLRGMAGRSVRLDVLRLASGSKEKTEEEGDGDTGVKTEAVVTVPLDPFDADDLLYKAWEWKTRKTAESLAKEAGFSVGYVHLESMSGASAEDAFARGFFPNYDKEAFILDVRHNRGGSIDAWVLDVLQRKPWQYWQSRDFNVKNGGLGWDEHFAFRGHIIVLMDEKTSSDGEGVSRGIKELGLGRLIGMRTWGGGIWLSSDNHMVDGGIATVS